MNGLKLPFLLLGVPWIFGPAKSKWTKTAGVNCTCPQKSRIRSTARNGVVSFPKIFGNRSFRDIISRSFSGDQPFLLHASFFVYTAIVRPHVSRGFYEVDTRFIEQMITGAFLRTPPRFNVTIVRVTACFHQTTNETRARRSRIHHRFRVNVVGLVASSMRFSVHAIRGSRRTWKFYGYPPLRYFYRSHLPTFRTRTVVFITDRLRGRARTQCGRPCRYCVFVHAKMKKK